MNASTRATGAGPGAAARETSRRRATGATSLFERILARTELALAPLELHAHQLLVRPLTDDELEAARSDAGVLTRALGRLHHPGLAEPARRIEELLEGDDLTPAVAIEIAGAIEDTRTMLASAAAQLETTTAPGTALLAIGASTAAFDTTLWVLAGHGHAITHSEAGIVELDTPPEVVVVDVGSDPGAEAETTLRAVEESFAAPVVVIHHDAPVRTRARLARYCSSLLPATTSPAAVSDEIFRLRAAASLRPRVAVWGLPAASEVFRAHGYEVVEVDSAEEVIDAACPALVIGAEIGTRVMLAVTRLLRVTAAARRAPVIWEGPLPAAALLAAARLGVSVVGAVDDAVAAGLTSALRRAAADTDPAAAANDTLLAWPAARLLIDRALVAAQRAGRPCAVAVVEFDPLTTHEERTDAADLLLREFRRGDVVGHWNEEAIVIALQGIGHQTAVDRLLSLVGRLGADVRVGVAEFPGGGRSADDLAAAAATAADRAAALDGPPVVSTSWQPVSTQPVDVMIVDSDLVLGEMVAAALAERGYRGRVVADGHDALAELTAGSRAELPRVLMVDLDFGGADGRALLSALAASGALSRLEVLAMSTRGSENDLRMALDLGAADVIRKPFPVTLLIHRLTKLLAR